MSAIVILFALLLSVSFYMLPTIIAILRKKKNTLSIGVLNFLLGWSIAGWVVSLVWALSVESTPQTIIINNASSPTKND